MLTITTQRLSLKKLFPLKISRGVSYGSENLLVFVSDGVHTGIGECAPGAGFDETLAPLAERQYAELFPDGALTLNDSSTVNNSSDSNPSISDIWTYCRERDLAPPALAAIDMALWDLQAKQLSVPLYRMLGLPRPRVATSVTIGINEPDVTRERVPKILEAAPGCSLKIKLGSPEGIEYDKAHFLAAKDAAAHFAPKLRCDANGGWTVANAKHMMAWLAEHGVDYIEQPLAEGNEDGLPHIFENRPLPIFVDESCRFSSSIPKWAHCVDGVNLKLMKCGGISEAMRIVATARAFGLKTMIGCMGECAIAIGAGSAIGALFDYIDLDSHLNLDPDPATGLSLVDGVVTPSDKPGHGVSLG